jgi:iron complex transport system substrate-binding protein
MLALFMACLGSAVFAGGNRQTGGSQDTQSGSREITDREGNKVTVPVTLNRIIATAPSITEVISDLGLTDKLVALDKYSLDVAGVNVNLPQLDFFNPDAEAIIGFAPDILIVNGINAVGSGDDPFRLIRESGIPVVYVPTSTAISAIYDDVLFIADLLGVKARGEELVRNTKSKVDAIAAVGSTITAKKSVYFEISPAPYLYTFGHGTFLNEMIELIGAKNIFGGESGWISPSVESILDHNPDVILSNVEYEPDALGEIRSRPGFTNITAVRNNDLYMIDANSSSRPSLHILLALQQIARSVYPEKYE